MVKKGDTLIEVTLAVGIFSLVAIAVVSVVNGSTTGAQTALETTLAREEIDAQAEALRFIQSSYASSIGDSDNPYETLWNAITKDSGNNANVASNISYENPATCSEIYDTDKDNPVSIFSTTNRSFVINTRRLGSSTDVLVQSFPGSQANKARFAEASTYPRIIYSATGSTAADEFLLDNGTSNTVLYRAEGIYVTAVAGPKTTIVHSPTNITPDEKAYYDFYIRTCWYGTGDTLPTNISTVIRLYNPATFNAG